MLPIPRHLKDILRPIGTYNSEFVVIGNIACDECSAENFTIKIVGDSSEYKEDRVIKVAEINDEYYLIIKAKCNDCNKEHLIFDKDFHGWDSFVCADNSGEMPRPECEIWKCDKCDIANHSLTVGINSQGKDNFKQNLEGEFDEQDWTEAFEWITIKIVCNLCGDTNDEWVSYETM